MNKWEEGEKNVCLPMEASREYQPFDDDNLIQQQLEQQMRQP